MKKVALLLELHQNFDRGILQGISAYASERKDWSIFIEEEPHLRIPNFHEWHGDGVIVNFDDRRFAHAIAGTKLKMVGIGGGYGWYKPDSGIPYVTTDNFTIGRMAAEHLLERGLNEFAFCGKPPNQTNLWMNERLKGFEDALLQSGYTCKHFYGRFSSASHWEKAQDELAEWLKTLKKPVGLMGCYDFRARHVLEACNRADLRVPDDVAVIGVDNDVVCELCTPPLSSVMQGLHQIGYSAAKLLDQLMDGCRCEPFHSISPIGVVSRQSTDLRYFSDEQVATALRLIHARACNGLQAAEVAAELKVSRSTLDKCFKAKLGRTVDHELRRVRLDRAKELLSRTNIPLRTVARESGYANEQYLNFIIKRSLGCTPLSYRNDFRPGVSA